MNMEMSEQLRWIEQS